MVPFITLNRTWIKALKRLWFLNVSSIFIFLLEFYQHKGQSMLETKTLRIFDIYSSPVPMNVFSRKYSETYQERIPPTKQFHMTN